MKYLTVESVSITFFKSKQMLDMDVDGPHLSESSQPVEKLHDASHPADAAFGVAVPITFTVLKEKMYVTLENMNWASF